MAILFSLKEGLKNAHLVLHSLKHDHEQSLLSLTKNNPSSQEPISDTQAVEPEDSLEASFFQEKFQLLTSSLGRIHDGLEVTELLTTVVRYTESLEAELTRLRLRCQRLSEETDWLRHELKFTQAKLVESETGASRAAVERRHFEFLLEMRQFDDAVGTALSLSDRHCAPTTECPIDTPLGNASRPHYDRRSQPLHHYHHRSPTSLTSSMFLESELTSRDRPPTWQQQQQPPFDLRRNHQPLSSPAGNPVSGLLESTISSLFYLGADSVHCGHLGTSPSTATSTKSGAPVVGPRREVVPHDYYHLDLSNAPQGAISVVGGPGSPPRVRTLHRIVLAYTSQGRHDVAASLCLRAIDQLQRNGDALLSHRDKEIERAVLLNMLALIYRDQGKYKLASELLSEVVSIREKVLGSENLLVAWSLNNLAVLYAKTARFDEAEPLCRRALAIREKILGPSHPDVARQLNNLALLCQSQRRYSEVESCFRRALDIYLRTHKPWTPVVLRTKNNLASALVKQGNLGDAELLLKAVLTPDRPLPGETVSTLDNNDVVNDDQAAAAAPVENSSRQQQHPTDKTIRCASRPLPLWLLAEQQQQQQQVVGGSSEMSQPGGVGNHPPSPGQCTNGEAADGQCRWPVAVDLAAWAAEARIEASLVMSAVRNLAIVSERLGQQKRADLLRSWLQSPSTTADCRTSTTKHVVSVTPVEPPRQQQQEQTGLSSLSLLCSRDN